VNLMARYDITKQLSAQFNISNATDKKSLRHVLRVWRNHLRRAAQCFADLEVPLLMRAFWTLVHEVILRRYTVRRPAHGGIPVRERRNRRHHLVGPRAGRRAQPAPDGSPAPPAPRNRRWRWRSRSRRAIRW
jgi:hypothetical protein